MDLDAFMILMECYYEAYLEDDYNLNMDDMVAVRDLAIELYEHYKKKPPTQIGDMEN